MFCEKKVGFLTFFFLFLFSVILGSATVWIHTLEFFYFSPIILVVGFALSVIYLTLALLVLVSKASEKSEDCCGMEHKHPIRPIYALLLHVITACVLLLLGIIFCFVANMAFIQLYACAILWVLATIFWYMMIGFLWVVRMFVTKYC